jgi:hypothetical protein
VRPLVDGEPAFQRICESIDPAQHSLSIRRSSCRIDEKACSTFSIASRIGADARDSVDDGSYAIGEVVDAIPALVRKPSYRQRNLRQIG